MIAHNHEWPSFGELLKTYRTQRRLTQQQLAEKMGMHRHAIGRWEQGDGLPAKKPIVLELARHLHLDDAEARQLLEASFTALAPSFMVPYPRNPLFTGREDMIEHLHQRLSVESADAFPQSYALCGLGGVGKTQLALEYAYRHALEYTAVFWITAEHVETILSSFAAIADLLQLPERRENDQQQTIGAVQRWLATHGHWLLVWDNLEDVALVQHYLPSAHQGAILVTTRSPTLGAVAQGLELSSLSEEEGIFFLLRRARLLAPSSSRNHLARFARHTPGEYAAARELVRIMGGLPLALDQVGAYVEETPCRLVEYLTLYRSWQGRLLQRRGQSVLDHPTSVVTTWSLSFERVEQANETAANLLRFCAFLYPEGMPEELFLPTPPRIDEPSESQGADVFAWHEAIRAASAYSLLKRNPQEQTLSMHRLVQTVLRERMSELERGQWQLRVIQRLNTLFPTEATYEAWPQCELLLPHVLTCAKAMSEQAMDQDLASVLYKAANYLRARARFEQAEPLYRRVLLINERVLGSEHPQVASPLSGLATLFYEQGKYIEAESLAQRALGICEQTLGLDHSEIDRVLTTLALLLYKQGKYAEAEPLARRVLHIRERALGPEHSEVARSLNLLASIYGEQGKYVEAEPLFQQVLRISEQALGSEHPQVADPLYNLATIYIECQKYAEAEPLYQRALHIWEQALGPEHPDVAYPLDGLANLSRLQGKHQQAELFYQRSLGILEQALGPEHPDVARSLNGLAILYREQGREEEVELFYRRALGIQEKHFGELHPETAKTLADLARLYAQRGDDEQARSLLQRACTTLERLLGPTHPETVKALSDYHQMQERRKKVLASTLSECGQTE